MFKLTRLHEDDDVLVIDKPAGINVHAGAGHADEDTVVDFIQDKVEDDGSGRPGIVHRLDRDTSGVLVTAKHAEAKKLLQEQFKSRQVQKQYVALVVGRPRHSRAVLNWPIGRHPKNPLKRAVRGNGREAITGYTTLEEFDGYTLLELKPKTGRMHQIRVHLAHLGHPVVGDALYGKHVPGLDRHFLHAQSLTVRLPSGASRQFTAELPRELKEFLGKLV